MKDQRSLKKVEQKDLKLYIHENENKTNQQF
jgi:hypothetical protein